MFSMVKEKWATILLWNTLSSFLSEPLFFTFLLLKVNPFFRVNVNGLSIYNSSYMIRTPSSELLKCFIFFLWQWFSALYLVATYILSLLLNITKQCSSLAKTGYFIFIVPWESWAPCLAHKGLQTYAFVILFYICPLPMEEHLCIMESPGTKTTISLGSICNTVI